MLIKKFIAPTMPEALSKVKKEFGDQAVILKTRMNKKAGGPGSLKGVEVTAAIESNTKSRFELPEEKNVKQEAAPAKAYVETKPEQHQQLFSERFENLSQQIAELKKVIDEKNKADQKQSFFGSLSANMLAAGRDLVSKNVSEDLAMSILSRLSVSDKALSLSREEINRQIEQILCSLITPGEPIDIKDTGTTTVMFVGPTGSGKTAAVARVAMNNKIENNQKVAIITADNFRADSSQQIKSYCRIIGCPCGIIYTPEELSMAIKSQDSGLILVDTPGVSPNDDKEIGELQSLIRTAKPNEIHLVIPAFTPAIDVEKMLDVFGEFGIDKIFITKLDETEAPGGVITAVINSGKKLSYISRSREIPGQFGPALPESLVKALIEAKTSDKAEQKWEMEAVGIWQ